MSLLQKVTKKAYHAMRVADSKGGLHDVKILQDIQISSRVGRIDRQVVVDTDSTIVPGAELLLYGDGCTIVSYKQPDFHSGNVIRYVLDCIDSTHRVDIKRASSNKSKQGGLIAKDDAIVYSAVPVKIGLSTVSESKSIDYSQPKYVMYLSVVYDIQVGDRVELSHATFEPAKVNSLSHVTPGLYEVRFDIDPRWL